MRLIQLNLAYDAALRDPEQLLDRYHTLTGWSRALTAAGAEVHVVQRFARDATVTREGVVYDFVSDGERGRLPPWSVSTVALAAIGRHRADVVHVNGLMFPRMIAAVRMAMGDAAVVVAQDHSGVMPQPRRWPLRAFSRLATGNAANLSWTDAFRHLDACMFTSRGVASRWHAAGLPDAVPIIEIPEASTTFAPLDHETARAMTGISGTPALLWVGRVDANKDPLTVLAGFEQASRALPDARFSMIIPATADARNVRTTIASSSALRRNVTIVGAINHDEMPRYFSAADVFVSGSHHEGSGYALIEAMACGVVPCVTDIPAFRALADDCGALWRVGDAGAFATALETLLKLDLREQRMRVRQRFVNTLSWTSIGQRTVAAYLELLHHRRSRAAQ